MNTKDVLKQIAEALDSPDERSAKAQRIADVVRLAGSYRWVGIYHVGEQEIAAIALSGKEAPAYPQFPVTEGLSGHAISTRSTVVSNDVANDPLFNCIRRHAIRGYRTNSHCGWWSSPRHPRR